MEVQTMMSDRGNLYIHVYTTVHPGTIFYQAPAETAGVGENLIDFIYQDLSEALPDDSDADCTGRLKALHPYFRHLSEHALKRFVYNSTDPSYEGSDSVQGLLQLQKTYKAWLLQYVQEGFSPGLADTAGTFRLYTQSHFTWLDGQPAVDYYLLGFQDCLYLEFWEMIRAQTLVKICKNCRRLFLPKKSNIDYCSRIVTKDQKTCQDVGYTQTFARSVKSDDLLLAYTRAYKAHYARMTKPRKHAGNLSRADFEQWYQEAKKKLALARSGQLDAAEYKEWLKK